MDIDQKIMSLMLAAEDQQESIRQQMDSIAPVLKALEANATNLSHKQHQLTETINNLSTAATAVNEAFSKSLPQFKLYITRGVNEAVSEHLKAIGTSADKAVSVAFSPLLDKVQATTQKVEASTHKLSMKYFVLIVFSVAALTVAAMFAVHWQEKFGLSQEIDSLRLQKATLSERNMDLLLKGAAIKIIDCADAARKPHICVEVGSKPEIISSGNRTYVVPLGY